MLDIIFSNNNMILLGMKILRYYILLLIISKNEKYENNVMLNTQIDFGEDCLMKCLLQECHKIKLFVSMINILICSFMFHA